MPISDKRRRLFASSSCKNEVVINMCRGVSRRCRAMGRNRSVCRARNRGSCANLRCKCLKSAAPRRVAGDVCEQPMGARGFAASRARVECDEKAHVFTSRRRSGGRGRLRDRSQGWKTTPSNCRNGKGRPVKRRAASISILGGVRLRRSCLRSADDGPRYRSSQRPGSTWSRLRVLELGDLEGGDPEMPGRW